MKHGIPFAAVVLLLCVGALASVQAEETAVRESLDQPRSHILMRHAEAPGTGDPAGFRLGVCSTQRNLSEAGRDQARRIGRSIKEQGMRIDRVLTSQWCRASETAGLLELGPVVEDAALNSFFDTRETSLAQSDEVKRTLSHLDGKGQRAILVTHQVNITALTGVFPASGEMIIVRLSGRDLEVLSRSLVDRPEGQEPGPQP